MPRWLDDIEREATERLHVRDEHMLDAENKLRLVSVLREAEAALEKIRKRAAKITSCRGGLYDDVAEDVEFIEDVARDALGYIARGGDEQACPTCGGTKTSPVHIGDGRIEDQPCPTCRNADGEPSKPRGEMP